MHGYFAVLKTSHYAITATMAAFTLPNLPAGQIHNHRLAGRLRDQTQEVTITGSETKTVDFIFKAKPY